MKTLIRISSVAMLVAFVGSTFAQNVDVASRKVAATEWLSKQAISIKLVGRKPEGTTYSLSMEAYPMRSAFRAYGTNDRCYMSEFKMLFSVNDSGELVMDSVPPYQGCTRIRLIFDPITKEGARYDLDAQNAATKITTVSLKMENN